jgi:hypothetical protein
MQFVVKVDMATITLTSSASTEPGFSSLWRVLASQKVVVNTQPISQADNFKSSYTNKKTEIPFAKETPKFAQQPTKNHEVKAPYKSSYPNTNNNFSQKNSISNTTKNANSYTYTVREKTKPKASSYNAPIAKSKETNITKKTSLSNQASNQTAHITASAQAQIKLLQKNQETQNGDEDRLGTQINLSA